MTATPAEMIAQYVKLRDYKKQAEDEFKASMSRVVQAMNKLEGLLLEHLNANESNSIACDAGTVYIRVQTSVTVEDAAAFKEYVEGQGAWDALDMRANKTFVNEMIETTGEAPPGVRVSSIQTVGVRRSS